MTLVVFGGVRDNCVTYASVSDIVIEVRLAVSSSDVTVDGCGGWSAEVPETVLCCYVESASLTAELASVEVGSGSDVADVTVAGCGFGVPIGAWSVTVTV